MYLKKLIVIALLTTVMLIPLAPPSTAALPPISRASQGPINDSTDGSDAVIPQADQDMPYKFYLPFITLTICTHVIDSTVSVADARTNYAAVKPGDTVCIDAGVRNGLVLKNFTGTAEHPITFRNFGGQVAVQSTRYYGILIQNSRFFRLTGSGSPGINYGIKATNATNVGIYVTHKSSDFEIDHIEVTNVGQRDAGVGILSKTEAFCSDGSNNEYDYDGDGKIKGDLDDVVNRYNFTQYNSVFHDNYIHNVTTEGLYIGSSFYQGKTLSCNSGSEEVYAPLLRGVSIYSNIIEDTDWDGLQVGSAVENCGVHHNRIYRDSRVSKTYQESGIMNNPGSTCHIYNNFIQDSGNWGIYVHGNGGNRIYNNVIVNPGQLKSSGEDYDGHGIIIATGSNPGNSIDIFNNTIVRPKSFGIDFHNNKGTDNKIQNNIVIDPGSYVSHGEDAYIQTWGHTNVIVSNNLNARNTADARIDPSTFRPYPDSPAVDSGINLSSEGVLEDYDGTPRPQGLGFDRGAFECAGTFIPPVRDYVIFRAPNSLVIDGDLSEFQVTEPITITQPDTGAQGIFKFLWDDNALYVAAMVTDSQLNAEITERDGSLWEEDSLELMLDTLHNHGSSLQPDDYKFFVNLLNTHRDSQGGDASWDTTYDSAVTLSGSNNDNINVDQGYTIEIRIPWSSLNLPSPGPGTTWGLDVTLNDRDAIGTRYYAAWANLDAGSLNNPDGWGNVEFAADTPTFD